MTPPIEEKMTDGNVVIFVDSPEAFEKIRAKLSSMRGTPKLICHCGKLATYRVGVLGYCSTHRADAIAQIDKSGEKKRR